MKPGLRQRDGGNVSVALLAKCQPTWQSSGAVLQGRHTKYQSWLVAETGIWSMSLSAQGVTNDHSMSGKQRGVLWNVGANTWMQSTMASYMDYQPGRCTTILHPRATARGICWFMGSKIVHGDVLTTGVRERLWISKLDSIRNGLNSYKTWNTLLAIKKIFLKTYFCALIFRDRLFFANMQHYLEFSLKKYFWCIYKYIFILKFFAIVNFM